MRDFGATRALVHVMGPIHATFYGADRVARNLRKPGVMRASGVQLRRDLPGPMLGAERARLVFVRAGQAQSFVLRGSQRLGRHPDNDLQLLDSVVSKFHCRIELRGSSYVVVDDGSLNGTYVNGQRVLGEHLLADGDAMVLGSTQLWFQAAGSNVAPPRPPDPSLHARFAGAVRGVLDTSERGALLSGLLRVAIDLFAADWGALVELAGDGTPRPHFPLALPGSCAPPGEARFDAELVDRARRVGHAALRVEWTGDAYRAAKPRTLIALPLAAGARCLGVLWLERAGADQRGPFAELELLGRLAVLKAEERPQK